ncbi:hypothetical protein TNCV_1760351 [Trichonephila clavipes]|nr:hypothetical protein TNCV_1760351 [Trichonephila clavipes]
MDGASFLEYRIGTPPPNLQRREEDNDEWSRQEDSLAKEGRNDDQLCPTITLADANAFANYKLLPHRYKKPLIVDFDCSRNLTSIIARLRTGHFKGMKISSDKTRTYIPCKNCTESQLTQDRILECLALTLYIIRLRMVPLASELREVLYSADAPRLAEAVQRAHDIISLSMDRHDKKKLHHCD